MICDFVFQNACLKSNWYSSFEILANTHERISIKIRNGPSPFSLAFCLSVWSPLSQMNSCSQSISSQALTKSQSRERCNFQYLTSKTVSLINLIFLSSQFQIFCLNNEKWTNRGRIIIFLCMEIFIFSKTLCWKHFSFSVEKLGHHDENYLTICLNISF